ncbi:MAG: hypothetical protein M9944_13085 [Rhizobiaceae bacterium]|nr:hypothetical protein [Rhizobiaceae bacterium]
MAGFLAALGGAMTGLGTGLVENARAKREAAIENMRMQMQMQRDQADRDFRAGETDKTLAATAEQNRLNREQAERLAGAKVEARTTFRPMTVEEKQAAGIDPKIPAQIDSNGKIDTIGSPGTNITVDTGTIPAGYRANRDSEGRIISIEPLPGSPAGSDAEKAREASENREKAEKDRSNLITTEIDRALGVMDDGGLPSTGMGAKLSDIPWTNAKALSALLATIKANIGFAELNSMRQQSPTGGALGNVTERELEFLQSVAGNLDQSQDADQLRYNLNRLWNTYMDVIHGQGKGPERRDLNWRPGESESPQNGNATSGRAGKVQWSIE